MGDESYGPVADGNLLTKVCALAFLIAHLRQFKAALENPKGSFLPKLHGMFEVIQFLTDVHS